MTVAARIRNVMTDSVRDALLSEMTYALAEQTSQDPDDVITEALLLGLTIMGAENPLTREYRIKLALELF